MKSNETKCIQRSSSLASGKNVTLDAQKFHDWSVEGRADANFKYAVAQRIEREKLRAEQLSTLQARLEALHDAKILGHEELHAVEDAIADAIDAEAGDDRVVSKLITLSSQVSSDRAFARQVQRKKWA